MKTNTKNKTQTISIPSPRTFLLTYRKKEGKVNKYIISLPIEKNDERFTAWAYSRGGFREFCTDRVLKLQEVQVKDAEIKS